MGLDCYFVKPAAPGETAPEPDWSRYYPNEPGRTPNVCTGLLSGNGADGSFRGKVYTDFVEALTMYSLYEELDNDDVKAISEALDNFWKELQNLPDSEREAHLRSIDGYGAFREYVELEIKDSPFAVATDDINWREIEDFVIMFRAFAELGYGLLPWW